MQIKNAHQNNLKNINLTIPENQLIVVTGLSGSGKSSLAMDVVANEGYRYFLESLPAYTQQNAHAIPTAEVDDIADLPPVVKVEQSKRFQSIKATFGTLSELGAVFRILFARYAGTEKMSKSLFSFNHPKGACPRCRGIGEEEYIDVDKLIGDENKTLREGAITTTLPQGYIVYSQITVEELNKVCKAHGFNIDIPWKELTAEQKDVVLNGSDRLKVFYGKHSLESRLRWEGLKAKPREEGYYRGMLPIMQDILRLDRNKSILRFASSRVCLSCEGARIKPEHLVYRWKGLNFDEWMQLPLTDLYGKLQQLDLTAGEATLVDKICTPLIDLIRLGMHDYRLSTPSTDISSGDGQRIKLIKQVNSSLQGVLYVFDEPSIGLSKDYQEYLFHILRRLISRGNKVLVVEHDLNFIQSADWIVELGPESGIHGGNVVFNGKIADFLKTENLESPTLNELKRSVSETERPPKTETETSWHPQEDELTVISRKTEVIVEKIKKYSQEAGLNLHSVSDQPIGKTPRSNPATYTGLATKIRNLLAKSPEAKTMELGKSAFSFNNKRGRCPICEGAGVIRLSMSMMGTVNQVCPNCQGKRFKPDVLQVHWKSKSIADIYELSVNEAYVFFEGQKNITKVLELMKQLGLGYLKLGQASNTLSGGEAQRVKLTKHFAKRSKSTLLLLEEPSIGLHQYNVRQLLKALHQLKTKTAGIVCFENHALFQSSADRVLDNATEAEPVQPKKERDQRRNTIVISGARTHHLKDLDLTLPKNKLSVITGISGSGKSSLLIDTLQGFGLQEMTKQFSSYQQSRVGVNFQFEVDRIEGLSPTICVTRKQKSFTKRSDLAKQTGIDKALRFAFSRKAQYEGKNLSASHFSNNHELGKCPVCDGMGEELLPDINKIVLDEHKSITGGLFEHNKALTYYGQPDSKHMAIIKTVGDKYGFSLETPFEALTEFQKEVLFRGAGETVWTADWQFKTKTRTGHQQIKMPWKGLFYYLKDEYYKTRKNKYIKNLNALLTPEKCSHCIGSGLQPQRLDFSIGGQSIHGIKTMDFNELHQWLETTTDVSEIDRKLMIRMRSQLIHTITRAKQLHIDYLQFNRKSTTLSGGENQRVALIKQLNSPLKGVTYLLDEPSAGLSTTNIPDLIDILHELIDKDNTVVVIEHDKEIILAANHLIEMGPKAGKRGGQITFQGRPQDYLKRDDCHFYLKRPSQPLILKQGQIHITVHNLSKHNLRRKKLELPIGGITAITGPSGIGKTTLVKDILMPSLASGKPVNCQQINFPKSYSAAYYFEPKKLRAHLNTLLVDYINLLKPITTIFAHETPLTPRQFSYKTKASQCPNCNGKGYIETSLDVVANAVEICEMCQGTRYQSRILSHKVHGKTIAEVIAMPFNALKKWFEATKITPKRRRFLQQLEMIGLAHLNADQPVQSLSSGEKQRLLLLNWLKEGHKNALFIADEPSTGLHFADIDLLYSIFKTLSKANDILIIDHNPYLLEKIEKGIVLN